MRTRIALWEEREWVGVVQRKSGVKSITDLIDGNVVLSPWQIKQAFEIMAWDIYEEMRPEMQKECRSRLKELQDAWDASIFLMEAIALINIERHLLDGWKIHPSEHAEITYTYEVLLTQADINFQIYADVFEQVQTYRNTGVLQPPKLCTLGQIKDAQKQWADAVAELLSQEDEVIY